MKNDLSQGSVAVYTQRRRNKSIWLRSCMIIALVVVLATSYALIFPARTADRELICAQKEHVHDDSCWVSVLTCGLEENEEHSHSAECWTRTLICGMEEHVHGDACFAELPPAPELTEALLAPTEAATDVPYVPPVEDDVPAPTGEDPAPVEAPELPEEPEEPEEPGEQLKPEPVVEPTEPEVTEPEVTEPEVTEPEVPEGEAELSLAELEHEAFVELRLLQLKDIIDAIEFPDEGIDLSAYIDSAVFLHEIGGALVEDTWFENGETVKASIVYDIPRDIVTPESKYVYYQLPEGIRPIEETSGEVMDNGVPVGVYTITEDGRIHILFNDEFANGNAIVGTVEFSSWLFANDDYTDRVVEFENDAGTITIHVPDEQKYDLQIEKRGEFNDDYTAASYTLTISSEKGTGEPIRTIDVLTNQTPATLFSALYKHSLAVRHVAADGTITVLENVNVVWSPDSMSFTVEELPALGAGERYELSYTVDLDPDLSASFELDNAATATSGPLEASTSFFISYTCDITKSGAFNPVTGLIDWVITVNPDSHPVAGWYIEDALPYPAVGKVLLTTANGSVVAVLTPVNGVIKYTFPSNAPARPYFIRYSTAAPTSNATVRNTVTLHYDGHETSVTSEVEVHERAEGVDKSVGTKHMDSNGLLHTYWNFRVTLPVGELASYTFRDLISTPVMDVTHQMYLDSSLHFSYAAELEDAFRGNLRLVSDGVEYRYGDEDNTYVQFTVSYFDAQGNSVAASDETTRVARIVFDVTPLSGNTFHGYEIVADNYPTWLDTTGTQEGDYWSYENDLYLSSGLFDRATSFFRRGKAFQKQILTPTGYTGDDNYIDYADCNGELQYRLMLDLAAMPDQEFTVTDLLPAGMEYVEGSARAFFTTANLHGEYDGTFGQEGSFTVTAEPAADGKTLLTYHGTGVTDLMKQTYAYIGITYRVRLTDEALWNAYTHSLEQFTNEAAWGDYRDAHTVTVESHPIVIEKNGVQLTDETGENAVNRVRFTLEINLGEEDLDPESDKITLVDVLSASSSLHPEIDRQSVALYHYDPTKPDHLGNRLLDEEFGFSYNEASRKITVVLNDETAYVLVYDYIVDSNAILSGQTQIANEATLAGVFHSSSEVVLQGVISSATAYQRVVTVTKVDENNQAKVLPGAEFSLERWDVNTQQWVPVTDPEGKPRVYVSNQDGKVVLSMIGEDHDIDLGVLYRLTETRAPVGYENDGTVLYFICEPRENEGEEAVLAAAGAGSGLTLEDVEIFGWDGGSCHITNRFSGLIVHKRWFGYYGDEMNGNERDPITVRLYASTDPSGLTEPVLVEATELIENPIILGPDNEWTYTWGNLPTMDEDGNTIYYFVAEDPVPGFKPVYINNGTCGGSIVISNNSEPFELPETGSSGTGVFVVFGVAMILLAAGVYIKSKFKMEVTK